MPRTPLGTRSSSLNLDPCKELPHDHTHSGDCPDARRLNIGCGLDLRPGWVNLDMVDYGGNTVCDLNRYPWPFPDSHFDEVLASHILEHMGISTP